MFMYRSHNYIFRKQEEYSVSKAKFGKRLFTVVFTGVMSISLVACGSGSSEKIGNASVNIEPYSKIEFNTEQVKSGDIQSSISLELKPDGYSSKDYSIQQSDYQVQEVYVKEGDKVAKGDVMIQFKAKEIQKTIDEYTEQKEQSSLLIDHYNRLAAIDSSQDYSADIEAAKQSMDLADTYIKEQNERMKEYQVIADKDGTVTYVNTDLQYEYVTAGDTLITVDSGSSDYVAETKDPFEFKVGDIYDADFEEATFSLKLVKCDKYTSDATGAEMQKLTFQPVSDMAGVTEADKLSMVIEKPVVKNVVYVNKKAVFVGSDEKSYVYVVDDQGYRSAVQVEVGDTVDDKTIITTGLKAGEQVVIN